jgi:glutathione S-transferase
MTTVEPPVLEVFLHTFFLPQEQRQEAVAEKGRKHFHEVARMLEEKLRGREFLVGTSFTAADIIMVTNLTLAQMMGMMADFPALQEYARRHSSRPAFHRAAA